MVLFYFDLRYRIELGGFDRAVGCAETIFRFISFFLSFVD